MKIHNKFTIHKLIITQCQRNNDRQFKKKKRWKLYDLCMYFLFFKSAGDGSCKSAKLTTSLMIFIYILLYRLIINILFYELC